MRRSLYNRRNGLVAQLVRALACHARGRGFEPHPGRQLYFLFEKDLYPYFFQNALVAQSVEQGTENPRVGGSIPPQGTIKNAGVAQW